MNDRFRFRAIDNRDWADEDEKGKIYYDAQEAYDYGGGEPEVPATSFGCIVGGEGWIVEQCTGLKDKNGNLIYEGDIIAVANGSINGNVCISKWEVVWIEKEGRYTLPFWVADKPDFSHYVKVLGNIHENPELLEDK